MKEKMRSFMAGRYGTDQLGRFTMGISAACLILYMFLHWNILYVLTLAGLVWYYMRAMSRNHSKRYNENLRFLQMKNQVFGRFRSVRTEWEQRKIYRFYSCPGCHQKVRVPRGHGKISITCPRCHESFIRKS